jgi:hypothetical protein
MRRTTRNIRAYQDRVINTTQDRVTYVDIPVFYFNGEPPVGSVSGMWFPSQNVLLTDMYIACRIAATAGTTTVSLEVGDNNLDINGQSKAQLSMGVGDMKNQMDLVATYSPLHIKVTPYNWIRFKFLAAGTTTEDITIQLYARSI